MYSFYAYDDKNLYELNELGKMFLPAEEIKVNLAYNDDIEGSMSRSGILIPGRGIGRAERNAQKRWLYNYLSDKTGKVCDWGILTGVRPLKLFRELASAHGFEEAKSLMGSEYLLSPGKIDLLARTYRQQVLSNYDKDPCACGVYVGIPFCPTRCLYCSFTSNKITNSAAKLYMEALEKEIAAVSEMMKNKGLYAESIYIGGGTPTSLCEEDFDRLLKLVSQGFCCDKTREFTVECGRPDTITKAKLMSIKNRGADRISINPQSMKAHTLELIGRMHSPQQIVEAYELARSCGINIINMDLIAGLPEETPEDFADTVERVCGLSPENITVHTLAVKKASRLIEQDRDYAFRQAETVAAMLKISSERLSIEGYSPYYLYRQKHMAGNFENVGYTKPGTPSIYNIRIMEEDQSVIALGAGGISKVYYPEENRLERVPNVSNYEIYIERIQEMIKRKEDGFNDKSAKGN